MKFSPNIKLINNQLYIFSITRKKYVKFSPEELIRQYTIHNLIHNYNYPKSLISEEKQLPGKTKRFDILVFDKKLNPFLLIEVKAPQVKINEKVLKQVLIYNQEIKARYISATNGSETIIYDTLQDKFLYDFPNSK